MPSFVTRAIAAFFEPKPECILCGRRSRISKMIRVRAGSYVCERKCRKHTGKRVDADA